jgi:hypothetical protein
MHPKEMGFLLGFPGDLPTAAHLRATMCMLGQSASPLQSSWMFHHIGQILFQDTPTDPVAHINMMKEKLCFEKYHTWPFQQHVDNFMSHCILLTKPQSSFGPLVQHRLNPFCRPVECNLIGGKK